MTISEVCLVTVVAAVVAIKTAVLGITLVNVTFIILCTILQLQEQSKHFLFFILRKLVSPDLSGGYGFQGQVLASLG